MATYLENKMSETKTKEAAELAAKEAAELAAKEAAELAAKEAAELAAKEAAKKPKVFTKMRNVSNQTLQLTSGALLPEKTAMYNAAEFSTLHMFLEGVE
jgi:hypothetical protein